VRHLRVLQVRQNVRLHEVHHHEGHQKNEDSMFHAQVKEQLFGLVYSVVS